MIATLNPVYVHLFMVGFVAQMIFGVAFWMPRDRDLRASHGGEERDVVGERPGPTVAGMVNALECVRPPVGRSDGGGRRLRESG